MILTSLLLPIIFVNATRRCSLLSKYLFVRATENALAQAVWLSPQFNAPIVSNDVLDNALGAYEARSWNFYYKGDWHGAVQNLGDWFLEEPYATVPAIQGSFIAATFLQDYELAMKFSLAGLRYNENSWSLRNNLIVSLAMIGETERARTEFNKLPIPTERSHEHAVWIATNGLLSFREGDAISAREFYLRARDSLISTKDKRSLLTLALYQSTEESRLGYFNEAKVLIQEVYKRLGLKENDGDLLTILGREVMKTVET